MPKKQFQTLMFTLALVWFPLVTKSSPRVDAASNIQPIEVASVAELRSKLSDLSFRWPPRDNERIHVLKELPHDFPEISDTGEKKHLFIKTLAPIVLIENRTILEQRKLAALMLKGPLPGAEHPARQWLAGLFSRYRLKLGNSLTPQLQQTFLRRIDEVPSELVLAQAAIESGWGTSRFALEGNSLFGQWTYQKGDGLTPAGRDEGATHQVKAFPSLQASVQSYLENINTHQAYRRLREIRAAMRARNLPLDPFTLASGLDLYSQRGHHYVDELRNIMKSKDFVELHESLLRDPR